MSVSGSVRINTRLDNSQLMKDCRALKTVVTEVANAVKRAFHGREIQALEQQMEATREAMSPIVQELTEIENRASAAGKNSARDFQKAQAEAGKLQQQYDALLNKISEYEAKARAPFDAQLVTYKPTQTDLANNAAVEQQYAAAMASDQVYQKMIADAEQLRAKQYQVNQTVQQMKQAADDAGGTSSARYTELQGELEALRGRTQDLNDQLRNLGVTGNNTGGMIAAAIGGAASRAFSTLQKGARSVLKTFGTLVKSGIGKITSSLAQSGKGLQTFLNRLGSIAAGALVFNVISAGLRNMTNYMGQALLSSASLRTALGNLSGAAQTAAAPLIQVLTPALTALASAAATVFGYIAQLVSFLTGTTVSAASDAAAGVAGVGSAAEETAQQVKDASKSLAGFDELERLSEPQQDTGSGGGGGAGASQIVPNYDFQGKSPFLDSILDAIKAGDWYQVGELVAQKLNEGMAAIDWGPIDATAIRWATNLYNGLNGAVQNLDWGLLGSTIGNGLNTVLPYGLRKIDAVRTLTTESTAVLIPFHTQEIMQPGGIYYGQNAVSKNMLVADRRKLLNGNSFRLGVSGSGKSFSAKEEIVDLALSTEDDILILDPESEFASLVEALNGEVIRISATSDTHLNALDMDSAYGNDRNPLIEKSEFILSLFEQLVGAGNLSAKEKSILDRCTADVYRDYMRGGYKGQVPTLKDLYRQLMLQPEEEARGLALSSELFINGSLNTFAQETNVNTKSRIIDYDIRELGEQLMPLGMLVTLDSIFNRVIQNWKKGKTTWIFADEFYLLFRYEYSADFFYRLYKRIRKYSGFVTGLTQNVEELLKSDTARLMLANSEFLILLNQAITDRDELAALLNISDNQLSYITNVGAGHGLIRCSGNLVPFENSFPRNTKLYRLMTTKPGEA